MTSPSQEQVEQLWRYQYKQKLEKLSQQKESLFTEKKVLEQRLESCRDQQHKSKIELQETIATLEEELAREQKAEENKTQSTDSGSKYFSEQPMPDVQASTPDELYEKALQASRQEQWHSSVLLMEELVRQFPQSDLADRAIYWMAQMFWHQGEKALAISELERLLEDYPQSSRIQKARQQLQKWEGES